MENLGVSEVSQTRLGGRLRWADGDGGAHLDYQTGVTAWPTEQDPAPQYKSNMTNLKAGG